LKNIAKSIASVSPLNDEYY